MAHEILVTLTRGKLDESHHWGSYCVVRDGEVLRSRGDMDVPIFARSSAKPIQALAVVDSGAPSQFGLTEEELAVIVGSHSGSPRHARAAASILEKCGESPDLLHCGGHRSLDIAVHDEYVRQGYQPGRLEDNCSGKHAGMIAAAKARGEDPANYAMVTHPLQQQNLENFSDLSGVAKDRIGVAVDGCGVPTFAAPVPGLAQAIAGFTTPDDLPSDLASAARQLTEAVHKHPEMAGGDGRFDTELMRALPGKLVSKSGAEGLQVIGVLGERTGIAIKIDDGGRRAARAVACALLMDLGLAKAADLADLYQREVLNREQVPVGVVKVRL